MQEIELIKSPPENIYLKACFGSFLRAQRTSFLISALNLFEGVLTAVASDLILGATGGK